jgi:hypothetical protein
MVGDEGRVKVLDFGLAKYVRAATTTGATQTAFDQTELGTVTAEQFRTIDPAMSGERSEPAHTDRARPVCLHALAHEGIRGAPRIRPALDSPVMNHAGQAALSDGNAAQPKTLGSETRTTWKFVAAVLLSILLALAGYLAWHWKALRARGRCQPGNNSINRHTIARQLFG